MLALKQKRAAEAKAKAEAEAKAREDAEASNSSVSPSTEPTNNNTVENSVSSNKVSLLGIGGKTLKTNTYSSSSRGGKKRSPGEIRIQKDIAELDGGDVASIDFPNPNNLTNFTVTITPDSGFWKGATYVFKFDVPPHYPHSPPKVLCQTKIYHPNINLEGNVCLNILREDWKPVLDINAVIYGLIYLFYEPNPDDPLNHEAADLFRRDENQFQRLVQRTLRGGVLNGVQFQRLI